MHSSRMCTARSSSHHRGSLHPPSQIPLDFPLGCGPGPDPPKFPPWLWAWTISSSISPLAVGLDQIPLNFPLGCGPGPYPPQFPPWLWAYTDPPKLPPWVWAPMPHPPGSRPSQEQPPPPSRHSQDQTPPGAGTPPPRGQTHTCKNITFANFVCGR